MNSQKNNPSTVSPKENEPLGPRLERLYFACNRPCNIHPDPLETVTPFEAVRDREIVALVASSLAYGRVNQILKSIRSVLEVMGGTPSDYVAGTAPTRFRKDFAGFKHRFHTGDDIAQLLEGVKRALERYGTLERCFLSGFSEDDRTIHAASVKFSKELCIFFRAGESTLLPSPEKGSACKRLNLMLRWLVRKDNVDPGGWDSVPCRCLIVPLDTHMHRLSRELDLTARNAADWKTAEEVTEGFRRYFPEDPVRYDFSLTRYGINPEFSKNPFKTGEKTKKTEKK